jgi:hypothetical protein
VPGLYLLVIIASLGGVSLLARRHLPGVVTARLAAPVLSVLVVFLGFDAIGAERGWFASNPDWVVAIIRPGIPPEEPVLLAFLALLSVVLLEGFRRRGHGEGGDLRPNRRYGAHPMGPGAGRARGGTGHGWRGMRRAGDDRA